jgi:hypothetical protein
VSALVAIYGDDQASHIRVFRFAIQLGDGKFGAYYIGRSGTRSFSSPETGVGLTRNAAVADLWRRLHAT